MEGPVDVEFLLILNFGEALLTGVPGGNVFDICITEVGGKSVHNGILANSVTEVVQCFAQVILLLSTEIGVNRQGAHSGRTVTGMTDG